MSRYGVGLNDCNVQQQKFATKQEGDSPIVQGESEKYHPIVSTQGHSLAGTASTMESRVGVFARTWQNQNNVCPIFGSPSRESESVHMVSEGASKQVGQGDHNPHAERDMCI